MVVQLWDWAFSTAVQCMCGSVWIKANYSNKLLLCQAVNTSQSVSVSYTKQQIDTKPWLVKMEIKLVFVYRLRKQDLSA